MEFKDMTRTQFEVEVRKRALTDADFRGQLTADPKAALEGLVGGKFPDGMKVTILNDTDDTAHLVVGGEQAAGAGLSSDDLDSVAGGSFGSDFWKGFKSGFFTVTACTPNL